MLGVRIINLTNFTLTDGKDHIKHGFIAENTPLPTNVASGHEEGFVATYTYDSYYGPQGVVSFQLNTPGKPQSRMALLWKMPYNHVDTDAFTVGIHDGAQEENYTAMYSNWESGKDEEHDKKWNLFLENFST